MAVILLENIGQRYVGQSSDPKPTDASVLVGAEFTELDTGSVFVWDNTKWNLKLVPALALAGESIPTLIVATPAVEETNRLLRKLIFNLELQSGVEFIEVE